MTRSSFLREGWVHIDFSTQRRQETEGHAFFNAYLQRYVGEQRSGDTFSPNHSRTALIDKYFGHEKSVKSHYIDCRRNAKYCITCKADHEGRVLKVK